MKKLLILMLTLALVFALAACKKDKPCESHVDSDANGICDVCDAEVTLAKPGDTPGGDDPAPQPPANELYGPILADTVSKQLSEAESLKLEIDINTLSYEEYWYMDESNEGDPVAAFDEDYYEASIKAYATLSVVDGDYRLKIDLTVKNRYDANDELQVSDEVEIYMIDGFVYKRLVDNVFEKSSTEFDINSIATAIIELTEGIELTEEEKDSALAVVGAMVFDILNVHALPSDGVEMLDKYEGSIKVDIKPAYDDLEKYVTELDVKTVKVSEVINDALALVNAELTVEKLVPELKRVANLTVPEALAEIDAWLTENYDTTVQGLYDTIVNDPRIVILIDNYFAMSLPENPEQDQLDYIEEQKKSIRSFKIAEYLESAGMNEVKLFDLIISLIGNAEEAPTADDVFKIVDDTLAMTLEAFDENSLVLSDIKMLLERFDVDALDTEVSVLFGYLFALELVNIKANADITSTEKSSVEGKFDVEREKASVDIKVYELSANPVDIKLPSDAEIFNDSIVEADYDSLDPTLYTSMYLGEMDGELWIHLNIYSNDGLIALNSNGIPFSALEGYVLTIPSELLDFSYNGAHQNHDLTVDLVIEIDPENYTFKVITIPEFTLN